MNEMRLAVIVPAAGQSRRFNADGGDKSKIEADLGGRPVFLRAIQPFLNRPGVVQIILAVDPARLDDFRFRWGDKLGFHGIKVVAGGKAERWETVMKAMAALDDGCTHVAIHDAARPLVSDKLIQRVIEAAQRYPAVIPGRRVSATLKRVGPIEEAPDAAADPLDAIFGGAGRPVVKIERVTQTLDRRNAVEVQTPQVFELDLLRRAYAQISDGKLDGTGITDDAGLVEALGQTVYVVDGEAANFKITDAEDLELAASIVEKRDSKQAATAAKKRLFADEDE